MAATAVEELGWFRQLGRLAGRAVGRVKPDEQLQTRSANAAAAQFCAFELADAMEQGLAQELTTGFIAPPAAAEPTQRLVVERSEDHLQHVLASENGEPLLVARSTAKDSKRVDFYIPTGGDPPMAVGPAFTLAADNDAGTAWTLTSDRCECCAYLPPSRSCCSNACRVLARVRHFREEIGEGNAMCMEVDLPAISGDGSPAIWCPRAGTASRPEGAICLESRRPRWSAKLRSLTLDFRGRCSQASSKNFQLETVGSQRGKKEDTELLFGKTGMNRFVLDYRHPLGMAQAFAIALSVKEWK